MSSGKEAARDPRPIDEILKACRPEDFDGHTAFSRLSPEERLDWLAHAAKLIREFKGLATKSEG